MNERDITSEREIWLHLAELLMYLVAHTVVVAVYLLGMYEALSGNTNGVYAIVAAGVSSWLLDQTKPKRRTSK